MAELHGQEGQVYPIGLPSSKLMRPVKCHERRPFGIAPWSLRDRRFLQLVEIWSEWAEH